MSGAFCRGHAGTWGEGILGVFLMSLWDKLGFMMLLWDL